MPRYKVEEHEDPDPIPEDTIFAAKIVSVEEITDYDKKQKVAFKVRLNAPDTPWDGFHYTGKAQLPLTNGANNRLRQWAETLLGAKDELPAGFELDTEIFVNQDCRVVIGLFEKDDDKNPGKTIGFNFVSDFLPARNSVHSEAF